MKCLLFLSTAFLLSGSLFAQSKVGVIDIQRALVDTAEIKKASAELEARFKPRSEQLTKLQNELQSIQQKLQTPDLTPQAQSELQATGQRRQRDLQRVQEDLQQDVERERNDILQRAGARMRAVVQKIAEAKGLDMVVEASNLVYLKPAADITAEAIAEYDKAHPAK